MPIKRGKLAFISQSAAVSNTILDWAQQRKMGFSVPIKRGKLAFISQSAAVSNTILDWAQQREMGFSYFIALGDSLDIDVEELLDYLARDSKTSAILLYLEQLSDARRIVSAARSASRNKPILVIKSGRSPAAQRLLNTTAGKAGVYFTIGSRLQHHPRLGATA